MRRLAAAARWVWLLLALTLLGALAEPPGHARASENVAGLVVLDEDGDLGYALVTFEEEEISGLELLRRSGADPVTVSFGGLGEGVCGIGETGCAVDACRKRMCQTGSPDSPFWQSFRAGEDAAWEPLQLGASADRVRDGDVRLWAWTGTRPALAPITLDVISTTVGDDRNQIVWDGDSANGDDSEGSPLWLGLALVGVAGVVAWLATQRARSRPG